MSRRNNLSPGGAVALLSPGAKDPKGLPLEWVRDNLSNVERAIRDLADVSVDPDFKPSLPLTLSPAEFLAELRAHLDAIRRHLIFLGETEKVAQLRQQNAAVERIRAAVDALPRVEYDPAHTAGLESWIYRQKLASLRKECGVV
jgi:hypothetical protein